MAAGVLIEGGRPDTFASDRQITAFFGDHDHQMRGSGPRLAVTELPEAGRRRVTAHMYSPIRRAVDKRAEIMITTHKAATRASIHDLPHRSA